MKARGFTLILVLWVLVLLSIVAASFSSTIRVETRAGAWAAESVQIEATALAALHRTILFITAKEQEQRWQADGQPHGFAFQGYKVIIRVRNEGGKVDLNFAPREVLLKLFQQQIGTADHPALVDALIDWRDRDDEASPQGAEAEDYTAAGRSYEPSNAALISVSELSQVMGFNNTLVEKLRPFVTVYARRPKIDVSSAPLQVITALPGISREAAEQFVEQRTAKLAAGEMVDTQLLEPALKLIVKHQVSGTLNIEMLISTDSFRHREQAVVRLQLSTGQFEILSRTPLAQPESKTDKT